MTASRAGMALLGLACAFWPLWPWFVTGTMDGSNDYAGLLAAATAIAIAACTANERKIAHPLALPTALTVLYAAATVVGMAPPLRALCAFLALAALISAVRLGRRLDVALAALCVLALPLAASLQFYLGYPLRVLAGTLATVLLQIGGIGAVREGAMLAWNGKLISIDAPCSGVQMLWAGLYLACALAGAARLKALPTLAAAVLAVLAVVAANGLRAAALFQVETGLVELPGYAHEAIGVLAFIGAALAIVYAVQWVKGRWP